MKRFLYRFAIWQWNPKSVWSRIKHFKSDPYAEIDWETTGELADIIEGKKK